MPLVHGFVLPSEPKTWEELSQTVQYQGQTKRCQHPTKQQGLVPLTTLEALELYHRALRVSGKNQYHFPNLCGTDPLSDRAATIRGAGFSEFDRRFCQYLTLRNSLFGGTILDVGSVNLYQQTMRNFAEVGFDTELPPSEMLYVNDLFTYPTVFAQLADIAKRENHPIYVSPYQQSTAFAEMVRSFGLGLIGPGEEGLQVIDSARNKTKFRNFAAKFPGLNLLPFPRIAYSHSDVEQPEDLVCQLRRIIAYSLQYLARRVRSGEADGSYLSDGCRALFVQLVEGAGGLGNFIVHCFFQQSPDWLFQHDLLREGHTLSEIDSLRFEVHTPEGTVIHLCNIHTLVGWLLEKARTSDLEIAPFLEILYSFSIAAVVGESSFVFVGRMQQLNKLNAYEGYVWPEVAAQDQGFEGHYQNALKFQKYFSARLRWKKFFIEGGGMLTQGVDFAVIRLPDSGEDALIAVECNCRSQAPQPTEVLALSLTPWKTLLADGRLMLLGMDHLNCPAHIGSPSELRHFLGERNFPLSSYSNPYGLLIISVQDGQCMGLFGASSQQQAVDMLTAYRKVIS
jgi:hypothetical protein